MADDPLLEPRPIDLPTALPLDGPIDREAADTAKIFAAPDDPDDWPRWRQRLGEWRNDARHRVPVDDHAYDRTSVRWATRCFSVALVWLWDERLFHHDAQRFDVDRFLDTTADYGGFDAVVLWQAYPVIGIDERTQFDFYHDVPGIAEVVRAFQARNVKVFVDYNPWDTATTDAAEHPVKVAELVTTLGVDGVFLDTMSEGGAALRGALATLDPPPVLEGESKVSLERIADHQLSWAQWFADSRAPGVLRARWFERRHMLHHTRRWNRDHSEELQSAWMNGAGMLVWDAVFGSWVGWNERDRSTLRAMLRVQRAFADVLTDGDWTPLADGCVAAIDAGVFVSRYEHRDLVLWTVVNRSEHAFRGPVLDVAVESTRPYSWFDVTGGSALPSATGEVTVPARGLAGIVAVRGEVPPWLADLVVAAAADRHVDDAAFPDRPLRRVAPLRSKGAAAADAVTVAAGRHDVSFTCRLRETGMYDGAPFVEAWKPLPPLLHADVVGTQTIEVGLVAVGAFEVSNAEFAGFVAATGYEPAVPNRFAAHWTTGRPRPGHGQQPMAFVDLADCRAYAQWLGARLPTEFEWQLAAAGVGFGRLEPLLWNLTESTHSDGVTRFVVLKGGSGYVPGRSGEDVEGVDPTLAAGGIDWYFDGGRRDPSFSAKLLLGGLGVTRSSRIGFRCAWDLEPPGLEASRLEASRLEASRPEASRPEASRQESPP